MEKDVIKMSHAKPKPPKRNRPRVALTLASETVETLEGLVDSKDATCMSRAIDSVTDYYKANKNAVPVAFKNSDQKQAFIQRCISVGKSPSDLMEALALQWIKSL